MNRRETNAVNYYYLTLGKLGVQCGSAGEVGSGLSSLRQDVITQLTLLTWRKISSR